MRFAQTAAIGGFADYSHLGYFVMFICLAFAQQIWGKPFARFPPSPLSVCEAPEAPRRGDPRRGSPREKTVHRTVFSPRPALCFALSGACLLGPLRGDSAIAIAARGLRPNARGVLSARQPRQSLPPRAVEQKQNRLAVDPLRPFEKGRRKLFSFLSVFLKSSFRANIP